MIKNNKGFALIETIITVVVLTTTMVLLYSTISGFISKEKTRLYYDNTAYIYKTHYINEFIYENINKNYSSTLANKFNETTYIFPVGEQSELFENQKNLLEYMPSLYKQYHIEFLAYIKINDISEIKSCITSSESSDTKCKNLENYDDVLFDGLLLDYLLTLDVEKLDVEKKSDYILISYILENRSGGEEAFEGELKSCIKEKKNTNPCMNAHYFSWVYAKVNKEVLS